MRQRKQRFIQVENKNALLELLMADTPFEVIYVASNAFRDPKTKQILAEAHQRGIKVERVTRKRIERISKSPSCESVIGLKPAQEPPKLRDLVDKVLSSGKNLFVIILNNVRYAQNLGAILRTAYSSGVDAVIINKSNSRVFTEEVTRISMGASERVPIIQMNQFEAIKILQDSGVKVVAVHMEGQEYFKEDLSGNLALVLGSEDEGISLRVLERSDSHVKIPMQEGLGSLNVSASAAILMYEKVRQDQTKKK